MLPLVRTLFVTLRDKGVSYCHWKSNASLAEALNGEGDLDLLIDSDHQATFRKILKDFGFKKGVRPAWENQDHIGHYYGLDPDSCRIVHLHVYDALLTGGSLIKKYHFPIESDLLASSRSSPEGILIPLPEQELALLLIRKMLEHIYLPELFLLVREKASIRQEIRWLLEWTTPELAFATVKSWWPGVERGILKKSLRLLDERGPGIKGWVLGRRLRPALRALEILPRRQAGIIVWGRFFRRLIQKFLVRDKTQSPASGGAIIAVVGPDATGKSTIVAEIQGWLSSAFRTRVVHFGKPPATWLTLPACVLMPFAKHLFPGHRTMEVEQTPATGGARSRPSFLYALRRLMIAYERNQASVRVRNLADKGFLVVCDRYPSQKEGAMDGPQLEKSLSDSTSSETLRWMAHWEDALYATIPPPDIILQLSVSVGTALERNRLRTGKPVEEASYIASRHLQEVAPRAPTRQLCELETSGPLGDTLAAAKEAVWRLL